MKTQRTRRKKLKMTKIKKIRRPRRRAKKENQADSEPTADVIDALEDMHETTAVSKEKPNLKLYFNSDTQAAIVKFQTENDKKQRNILYVGTIMPAFEKLAENLINIHKFTGMHYTYEELKNDCVNFLFETIPKFDASLGSNAFSYFNVVARNWLTIRTKQKALITKRSVSLDNPDGLTAHETLMIEERDIVPPQDTVLDVFDSVEKTLKIMYDVRSKVKTENELACVNAIITIFENIDEIDLLNKRAILFYMRELSGLTPKQLATAMKFIKKYYKKCTSDDEC